MAESHDDEPNVERDGEASHADERSPKEELLEAIDHLRSAANLFFDKAAKDPTLHRATTEADRVLHKIAESAEPVARQVTDEVSRLTSRLSRVLSDTVDRTRRKDK